MSINSENHSRVIFLGILASFLPVIMNPLPGEAGEVRSVLDRWVETRKLISEERSHWDEDREQLERTLELLEKEHRRLGEAIARMEAETGAVELEKNRLDEVDDVLTATLENVDRRNAEVEDSLRDLFTRFPHPLQERTRALLMSRTEDSHSPPLAARVQATVGFLGEADRFQENVHLAREVIAPDGGPEIEVRVLYLGLGQAYYLGPSGERAGIGYPGENGWEWTPRDDLAPAIRQAFAIRDNQVAPDFVRLPVTLRTR